MRGMYIVTRLLPWVSVSQKDSHQVRDSANTGVYKPPLQVSYFGLDPEVL